MLDDTTVGTHESYGMISVSRVSSNLGQSLFGSSIKHSNTIMLRIKKGEVDRLLNRDWYRGKEEIVNVELSPTQYAEMLTCMNMGDGVPCTIRRLNGKMIEGPSEVKQRQIFEQEFQENITALENECSDGVNDVADILLKKGSITIKERKKALEKITGIMRIVGDYLPFIQRSFNESMDKTVLEAKGEVEAFVTNKVVSLGIEGLEKEMLKLTKG
jgi:hypothetical protein